MLADQITSITNFSPYLINPKFHFTLNQYSYFDGSNHIVILEICPVKYYPKSDYIEFISEISYSLQMKSSSKKIINVQNRNEKFDDMYSKALQNLVDNPEDIQSYSNSSKLSKSSANSNINSINTLPMYEYVIITSNSLSQYFDE